MSDEIKQLQDQLAAAQREKAQYETQLKQIEQDKKVGEFAAYAASQGVHFADTAAKVADYDGDKSHADMLAEVIDQYPVFAAKAPEVKTIGQPTPNEGETPVGVMNEPSKPIERLPDPEPEEVSDTVKLARAYALARKTGSAKDRVAYSQLKRELEMEQND